MSVEADLIVRSPPTVTADDAAPVDVGGAAWPLPRAAAVLAIAAALLAMTNSEALVDWAFELPLAWGPVRTALVEGSEAWHAAMVSLGLDRPHVALRDAFLSLKGLSCPVPSG